MNHQVGFTFHTNSSPVLPLRISAINTMAGSDRYSIEQKGSDRLWSFEDDVSMAENAFQQPEDGNVLIIPGSIAASSKILYDGALYSVCYLSTDRGCSVGVTDFFSDEAKQNFGKAGVYVRLSKIAMDYHSSLFQGRASCPEYVKVPAFSVSF